MSERETRGREERVGEEDEALKKSREGQEPSWQAGQQPSWQAGLVPVGMCAAWFSVSQTLTDLQAMTDPVHSLLRTHKLPDSQVREDILGKSGRNILQMFRLCIQSCRSGSLAFMKFP